MKIALAALLCFPFLESTAFACSRDWPEPPRLPYETDEDFETRYDQPLAAYVASQEFKLQSWAFDNAESVWIGTIVSKGPTQRYALLGQNPNAASRVEVEAVISVKGDQPSEAIFLDTIFAGSFCDDLGDGRGANAKVGELVVVFSGLPSSEIRPNGIYSIDARDIALDKLQYALHRHFGTHLD